ncbi:MAG: hypothetical protein CMM25_02530 [Rhodospirillaceae bacterium]|nr:hypothetical protein [Rhodospirillaceae bacterium]
MGKNYFLSTDPSMDRIMNVVIALARETYVLKDRLSIVERKLDEVGVVTRADLDEYKPSSDIEEGEILAARDEFVQSVLGPLTKDHKK